MMKNILTLNPISSSAAAVFGGEYRLSPDAAHPVGILVRSFDMHGYMLDTDTVAVARAGAGTNNITLMNAGSNIQKKPRGAHFEEHLRACAPV